MTIIFLYPLLKPQLKALEISNEKQARQLISEELPVIAFETVRAEKLGLERTIAMNRGKMRYLDSLHNLFDLASLQLAAEHTSLIGRNKLTEEQNRQLAMEMEYSSLIEERLRAERAGAGRGLIQGFYKAKGDRSQDAQLSRGQGMVGGFDALTLERQMMFDRLEAGSRNTGNSILAMNQQMADLNEELGIGSAVTDTLRVKAAEAYVRLEDFSKTLTGQLWDTTRSEMVTMFSDMVSGAKTVEEAFAGFVTAIARQIQEAVIGRFVDQVMLGLSQMFGTDMMGVQQGQLAALKQIELNTGALIMGANNLEVEVGDDITVKVWASILIN